MSLKKPTVDEEEKAVDILDRLIHEHRAKGFKNIPPNCDDFGVPMLNLLYIEIFKCFDNDQSTLALVGEGIFMEEFIKLMVIMSKFHKEQIKGTLKNWDEAMEFKKRTTLEVEDNIGDYQKEVRPVLVKNLDKEDLEKIEALRFIVRNIPIHRKAATLMEILKKHRILEKTISVDKRYFSDQGLGEMNIVAMDPVHPLFFAIGYKMLAKQIAPAVFIFIYELFARYESSFAPLDDKQLGFGHNGGD